MYSKKQLLNRPNGEKRKRHLHMDLSDVSDVYNSDDRSSEDKKQKNTLPTIAVS